MSSHLSIAEVLAVLEAQIGKLERQEAFHAQQETFHREQRLRNASELETLRERYAAFKTAATAAGEVMGRAAAPIADEDDGRRVPVSKLIGRLVAAKPAHERFGPSSIAQEVNARYAKRLRRPIDGRAASVALRRLLALGEIHLVREGKAFHEAVYAPGPKPARR